jgi:hypothetical protein
VLFVDCGVVADVEKVLFRDVGRDGDSIAVGVDTVGLDTISPQSSSSSTDTLTGSLFGVGIKSRAPRSL